MREGGREGTVRGDWTPSTVVVEKTEGDLLLRRSGTSKHNKKRRESHTERERERETITLPVCLRYEASVRLL